MSICSLDPRKGQRSPGINNLVACLIKGQEVVDTELSALYLGELTTAPPQEEAESFLEPILDTVANTEQELTLDCSACTLR